MQPATCIHLHSVPQSCSRLSDLKLISNLAETSKESPENFLLPLAPVIEPLRAYEPYHSSLLFNLFIFIFFSLVKQYKKMNNLGNSIYRPRQNKGFFKTIAACDFGKLSHWPDFGNPKTKQPRKQRRKATLQSHTCSRTAAATKALCPHAKKEQSELQERQKFH